MTDQTDLEIIRILKENSRAQWKQVGEEVHMTGQAVAARIEKLIEEGVLRRFTVDVDQRALGLELCGFITVFMKNNDHKSFIRFVRDDERILEANRISGEGCYLLKFAIKGQTELNNLLDSILIYGNYRVNISVNEIKP